VFGGVVACDPGEVPTTSGDTGGGEVLVAPSALGGEAPGFTVTREDPLSTFPLDGSQPYDGELPAADQGRFAVQTWLEHGPPGTVRLDVGLRGGPDAAVAHDVGVRLALNPQAVRSFRLRGARGTGRGTAVQRVPGLAPGVGVGATYDLLLNPDRVLGTGEPQRTQFLGTVTLSWTENGHAEQRVMVLDRP